MVKASSGATEGNTQIRKIQPRESNIVISILNYLNSLDRCYAIKTRGDQRQSGQPDILACYKGRMLALEVKRPGNKPTKLQLAILEKWKKAGAITAVVHSKDDVIQLLGMMLFSGEGREYRRWW